MSTTAEQLGNGLASGRTSLLDAIAGVTEEQFKRRPEPSPPEPSPQDHQTGWSIAEILAHLLASERLRAERIRLALEEDGRLITPSDPDAHSQQARSGRSAPVPQLIHGMVAVRREVEGLLAQASSIEGGLERTITHPVHGSQSVAWMLAEKIIAHEAEHLMQIEALKTIAVPGPPQPES